MNLITIKNLLSLFLATAVFLLVSNPLKAQCTAGSLYGWATQNGGTTGGAGGPEVVVTNITDFNTEAAKAGARIIYVDGTLTGQAVIKSDKTVFGLPGAKIQGNVRISGAHNVIVRNLIIRGNSCGTYEECRAGSDAMSISSSSTNVWLDHLDIADGQDGNCDVTSASDFVTISWCKFSYTYDKQHRFSNLVGSDDDITTDIGKLNITYHRNWWADRVVERQPRIRYGKIHVANNLYTSTVSNVIVGVGQYSNVIVESNIFTASTAAMKFSYGAYDHALGRNNIGPPSTVANAIDQGPVASFIPPYSMPIDDATPNLETNLRNCAGATLSDPRTTGIKMSIWDEPVMVAPQPFQNELKLDLPSGCTYQLTNIQGQVFFEGTGENKVIETSSLPEGIYLLTLTKGEKIKHLKLQKTY